MSDTHSLQGAEQWKLVKLHERDRQKVGASWEIVRSRNFFRHNFGALNAQWHVVMPRKPYIVHVKLVQLRL